MSVYSKHFAYSLMGFFLLVAACLCLFLLFLAVSNLSILLFWWQFKQFIYSCNWYWTPSLLLLFCFLLSVYSKQFVYSLLFFFCLLQLANPLAYFFLLFLACQSYCFCWQYKQFNYSFNWYWTPSLLFFFVFYCLFILNNLFTAYCFSFVCCSLFMPLPIVFVVFNLLILLFLMTI